MSATASLKRSFDRFLEDDQTYTEPPPSDFQFEPQLNSDHEVQQSSRDYNTNSSLNQNQQYHHFNENKPTRMNIDEESRPAKRRKEQFSPKKSTVNNYNYFPPSQQLGKDDINQFVERYKKQRQFHRQKNAALQNQTHPKHSQLMDKYFTEDEVKMLMQTREDQIREDYNKILQQRLSEQYEQFTKFSQDYISRQFKSTEFSYTS